MSDINFYQLCIFYCSYLLLVLLQHHNLILGLHLMVFLRNKVFHLHFV